MEKRLAHDSLFWRRLAALGAQKGPSWWVQYSPPVFGWAAALALPIARRNVVANLHRIRGEKGVIRDVIETAATFGNYAGCLAEVLANGSKNAGLAQPLPVGRQHLDNAAAERNGIVVATLHTGGWETVGPLVLRHHGLEVMMVMEPERDPAARELQDQARRVSGVGVAHISGDDPLAALPLLGHLQRGGIVALQLDRVPKGMRQRSVRLLGRPGAIPEGPIRLAQLSGAPLLAIFCARLGYRRYLIETHPAIHVRRRATQEEIDAAAQSVADAMTSFLRRHPTQWFHFGEHPT